MPEPTTIQPMQEVFNISDQWSQENPSNIVQNATNLLWNAPPNQNIVPESLSLNDSAFISQVVNNSMPIAYSSSSIYINLINPKLPPPPPSPPSQPPPPPPLPPLLPPPPPPPPPLPPLPPPPYPRYTQIHNGYPVGSTTSTQNFSTGPVLARPLHRPALLTNSLTTPQNMKLIQSVWKNTNGVVRKQKRIRTAFTSHQMMQLEQEYAHTRYLDRTRRIELAGSLSLNERTIKIWFQNRRMKEKKDRAESLEDVDDVTTTQFTQEVAVSMFEQPYQANNEIYNGTGIFVEQYPVSSTSAMTAMIEAPMQQESYSGYAIPEESPQYQQVHMQVQQYPSPYGEIQVSPESTPHSESSASVDASTPNEITENNWDLSWIKNIHIDEE